MRQFIWDIFLITFPPEIIWSLIIFNIKQLLKKRERQFAWKNCFFTLAKFQKREKTQANFFLQPTGFGAASRCILVPFKRYGRPKYVLK